MKAKRVIVKASVPIEQALAEYEKAKAKLPPGTKITIDHLNRPWLTRPEPHQRQRRYWNPLMRLYLQEHFGPIGNWPDYEDRDFAVALIWMRKKTDAELRRYRGIGPSFIQWLRSSRPQPPR